MRVHPKVDKAAEDRDGKWHHYTAGRKLAHIAINPSYSKSNCHSMRHSNQFTSAIPHRPCIMDASGNNQPTYTVLAPLPLNCSCPLDDVKPSICTATSKRCNLLCCIDFGMGIYHSHNLICNLTLASEPFEPSASNFHTEPTSYRQGLLPQVIMPRQRQRMRSRRGSSRGRLRHPSPSTVSESSSPSSNHFIARYLDTCSGRGHTRAVHPPSPQTRLSATASPLSSQPTNHSAQFTYHYTLNRPIIKATITIMFQEEPSSDGGHPTQAMEKSDKAQGEPSIAKQNQVRQEKADTGKMQVDEDDFDTYRCLINEEQPTATNDN